MNDFLRTTSLVATAIFGINLISFSSANAIVTLNNQSYFSVNEYFDKKQRAFSNTDPVLLESWPEINKQDPASPEEFKSIGKLWPVGCTVFLAQAKVQSRNQAPVYGVTNGHCFGLPFYPQTVRQNIIPDQDYILEFNDLGTLNKTIKLKVSKIIYSTMYQSDISILELENINTVIKSSNLAPIKVAKFDSNFDFSSTIFYLPSVPSIYDQYKGEEMRSIRISTCKIGNEVQLLEANYNYNKSFRHTCNSQHGSSGAPLILFNKEQRGWELFAIHNTSPDSKTADSPCGANAPCEISKGKKSIEQFNYAQDLRGLHKCFSEEGVFDINSKDCFLYRSNIYHGRASGNYKVFKRGSGIKVLNDVLSAVKSGDTLNVMGNKQPFKLSKDEVPLPSKYSWLQDFNNQFQTKIFGRILFPLLFSEQKGFKIILNKGFGDGYSEHGYILASKVTLDEIDSQIQNNREKELLLKFILIHEVSHYLYEWHLANIEKDFTSINGGISLDATPPMVKSYENLFKSLKPQEYLRLHNQSHAEIDWIALAAYTKFVGSISWKDYKNAVSASYLAFSKLHSYGPSAGNAIDIRFETMKDSWQRQ